MKYRSRIDIMCQILAVTNGRGVTKTRIMYETFLSFIQTKEFLMTLTESDLLRYDGETQTFRATEKGLRLLHVYNELGEFIKGISQKQVSRNADDENR
jgi:predicted transcriptional regulator